MARPGSPAARAGTAATPQMTAQSRFCARTK
jgi:hypothetical protein